MKPIGRIGVLILVFGIIFYFPGIAKANTEEEESGFHLKEIGLITGFGYGEDEINKREDYKSIILSLRLGYDLKSWLNLNIPGALQFDLEPFVDPIISPHNNVEFGTAFLLKYSFPLTQKFWPYLEGGTGVIYSTQHTYQQATQWNFLDQGGAGISYLINSNTSISLGYRFRHCSNLSIEEPNGGVDSQAVVCGISYLY